MSKRIASKGVRGGGGTGEIYVVGPTTFVDVAGEGLMSLPADINEVPDGIVIRVELPGIPADDVQVTVRGQTIEVAGDKRPDTAGAEASFMCLERAFGKFYRAFELSGCLEMTAVTAALREGVLTVFVPKREERRGRAIRIPVAVEP